MSTDTVTVNLTRNEADCLHSLLVIRRQEFTRYCQQAFHRFDGFQSYLHQLKSLEAKLIEMPVEEYNNIKGDESHAA
jgi:hypothetical protein